MEGIELSVEQAGEDAVLTVRGEIDLTTAPRLEEEIGRLAASAKRVALDLAGVDFMDSTGLRVLLKASKLLESQGGSVALRRPSEPVRRLLEVSGLDGHFAIVT